MPTLANGAIVAEHVWKRFRADKTRPRVQDRLRRLKRRIQGERRSYRWVLKDINLEVPPGGTMALIGINGSGKTTLLKVISKVTFQTAGYCETSGRIGALLQISAGINPMLSGRENIFLYAAILGLTRRQIAERFDAIVEFAELTDSVDRQVKYYSSGMQVRLGFSIAAHLEPDILLVDEVLAVGDANFQQKCLQRISDVVADGSTLIFVSHDLAAVEAMCERATWLTEAVVRAQGPTREVLNAYRGAIEENAALATNDEGMRVLKAEVIPPETGPIRSGQPTDIRLVLNAPQPGEGRIYLGISEGTAMPIFVIRHDTPFPAGDFEVRCTLRDLPVPRGRYYLWLAVMNRRTRARPLLGWRPVQSFDVFGPNAMSPPQGVMVLSPVYVDALWGVD